MASRGGGCLSVIVVLVVVGGIGSLFDGDDATASCRPNLELSPQADRLATKLVAYGESQVELRLLASTLGRNSGAVGQV